MKKLYKSNNKMIDGVCAGVAEYFNIDPTVVRVVWAIFSCMGGSGILAYIIAALVCVKSGRAGCDWHGDGGAGPWVGGSSEACSPHRR